MYGALMALGMCGNNVLNIIRMNSMLSFSDQGKLELRKHIKPLLSFMALGAASGVYLYLDSVILTLVSADLFQVGLYQVVTKLKTFMIGVIGAVINVLIPRLSYLVHEKNSKQYSELLSKSFQAVFCIALAACGYLLVFSDLILIFISSEKYIAATSSLQVVGIAVLCSSMSIFLGYAVLTPRNREKELAISNMAGIPISLTLNFTLDGRYGAMGASIAIALTELSVFGIQLYFGRDILRPVVRVKEFIKIIGSVLIAVGISLILRSALNGLNSIVLLFIGTAIFGLCWAVTLGLSRETTAILMLREIARRSVPSTDSGKG